MVLREQIRRTLYYYLPVYREGEDQQFGMLADITPQGCLVITEKPIVEGERLSLRIQLPRGGALEEESLSFEGIVRWTRKDENRPLYSTGILYSDEDDRRTGAVEKLIDHIGFSDGQKKIRLFRGDADFH